MIYTKTVQNLNIWHYEGNVAGGAMNEICGAKFIQFSPYFSVSEKKKNDCKCSRIKGFKKF
jgi:hypothetical protein